MALIKGKNKAKITAAILLVVSFLFSEIKPASALLNSYNKPWNGTLSATEWNNLPLDFLNKDGAATLMGPLTIGSASTSSSLYIYGPITSPVGAPFISSGEFGSNARYGDFYFGASGPGNVGIGTTTASHKLTVQGDINFTGSLLNNGSPFTGSKWTQNGTSIFYDAGNVGIGTSEPLASLDIKGVGTSSATFAFNVQDSLGANKFRIQNNGQALVSNIAVTNLPEFGFLNDTNTGLDWITTDTVGLMAGGASRFSCSGAACTAAVPTTLTRLTTTLDASIGTLLSAGRIGATSLILGGDPANNSLAALEAYGGVSAYTSPSGASIFYDTFSGGVTEQLPVHTPDIGTSWTMIIQNGASTASSRNTGFAGPTATVTDGGVLYTADANYTTADYEVSTYIQALTSSDDVLNLAVRIQDTDNMYVARVSSSVTGIYRKVGGTWTLLGSATTYITAGNYVKLRVVGNVLSLYRGDSLLLTVSDSNITGAGKAGLGFGDVGIITTDDHSATWQVDNFSVKLYEDANLAALFMNGNVGIGLTNPAARLHIAPGATPGFINTGSTQLTALGGAGSVFVMADNDGNIFSSSTSAIITPIVTPIITTAGGWTASGTVVYKTDPNGNVGIGTTNPGAKLDISGGDINLPLGSNIRFGGQLGILKANIGKMTIYGGTGNLNAGGIDLNYWNGSTYAPGLSLSNTSNVGIGTTNPDYKLKVVGTTYFDGDSVVRVASSFTKTLSYDAGSNSITDTIVGETRNYRFSVPNSFILYTGSTLAERMRVDSSGNVGIGTSSPISKLHVVGATGLINTGITQFTALGGVGNALVMTDNTGTLYSEENPTGTLLMPSGTSGATLRHDGTVWVSNTNLYNNGTNVGVGTSTPISKLDVIGSIKGNQFNIHNGSAYIGGIGYDGGLLAFKGGASLITRMAMTWDGKVGIGTTNPGKTFHVNDSADNNTAAALIHKTSSAGANSGLHVHVAGTTNSSQNYYIAKFTSGGTDVDNPLNTAMLIGRSGNVGIGTTNPNSKLEVLDEVRVRFAGIFPDRNVARIVSLGESGVTGANNWALRGVYQYASGVSYNSLGGDLDLIKSLNGNTVLGTKTDGSALGNVGIGTTSPIAKLHVVGADGLINTGITQFSALGGAGNVLVMADNTGTLYSETNPVGTALLPTGTNGQTLRHDGTAWLANTNLYNNGTNVGVGTTNPQHKFSVFTTSTVGMMFAGGVNGYAIGQGATSGNPFIQGYSNSSGASVRGLAINPAGGGVVIGGYSEGTAGLAVMNGNVGIGTTNPLNKFSVVRDAQTTPVITADIMAYGNTSALIGARGNNSGVEFLMGVSTLGEAFIGSMTNHGMSLRTNNTNRLTVNTAGNIGIGTTSPIAKLHVVGADGLINTGITQFSALGGAGNVLVMADNTGTLYSETNPVGTALLPTGTNGQTLRHDGTAWLANTNLYNNGTNVGIGTSNPTSTFEIFNSSSSHALTLSANDANIRPNIRQIALRPNASGIAYNMFEGYIGNTITNLTKAGVIGVLGNVVLSPAVSTVSYMYFGAETNTAYNNNTFRLYPNKSAYFDGNVGIGTTNPLSSLQINDDAVATSWNDATVNLLFSGSETVDRGGSIAFGGSTYYAYGRISGRKESSVNSNAGYLRFDTRSDSGTLEKMRITSVGNVGIGTTSPIAKLHVVGADGLINTGITQFSALGGAGNVLVMADNTGTLYSEENPVGTALLPTGTSGYTLRHNGTAWISNSNLFNNGTNVGVGTTNPGAKVEIAGGWADTLLTGDNIIVRKPNYSSGGWARTLMNFQEYDGTSLYQLGAYGSNNTLNYGYLGIDYSSTTMRWYPNKNVAFDGNVGIGTTAPGRKFVVQTDTGPSSYAAHFRQSGTTVGNSTLIGFSVEAGGWSKGAIGFKRTGSWDTGDLVFLNRSVSTDSTSATTENDVKMVINSVGNVGIGTSSPIAKLHVVGADGLINTGATQLSALGGAGNVLVMADNTGTLYSAENPVGTALLPSGTSGQTLRHDGTAWLANTNLYNNGTNVGIGTTAPGAPLEIQNNGSALGLRLKSTSSGYWDIGTIFNNTNSDLIFKSNGSEKFRVDANGNVGIGTTTPAMKLDVKASGATYVAQFGGSVSTVVNIGSASLSGQQNIQFLNNSNNFWVGLDGAGATAFSNVQAFPMTFRINTVEAMRIDSSRNIGIGTSSPIAKLHVVGATGLINTGVTQLSALGGAGNVFIMADNTGTLYSTSTSAIVTPIVTSASGWTASGTTVYKTDVNGNVGIGTTNPQNSLDVTGTITASTQIIASNNGSFGAPSIQVGSTNSLGFYKVATNQLGIAVGGGQAGYFGTVGNNSGQLLMKQHASYPHTYPAYSFTGDTNTGMSLFSLDKLSLVTGGIIRMLIDDTGKVGVGVTNPSNMLHVVDPSYDQYSLRLQAVTHNYLGRWSGIGFSGESFNTKAAILFQSLGSSYSRGNLIFALNNEANQNNATTSDAVMTLTPAGSVGIGTSSPIAKLHVVGADGLINTGATQLSALGGAGNVLVMADNAGGLYGVTSPEGTAILPSGTAGYTLRHDGTAWISNSNLFNSGTNVGIGTTNPLEKLHIVGNVRISGTLSTQTGSDFAEEFTVREEIEPGTVVVMAEDGYKSVKASRKAYDQTVVGVVSNSPSIVAGQVNSAKKAIIAMVGVVDVKVVNTNGSIKRGDLLTTSNVAGYAMRTNNAVIGTVIGKALEDMDGKQGVVKALINLQ